MSSPTQHTLKLYRKLGFTAAVVEHWNSFAHIRQDLFGFADVLAIGRGKFILIQTTTDSGRSSRRTKIEASPIAAEWLRNGGDIHLVTWGVHGAAGTRKRRTANLTVFTLIGDTACSSPSISMEQWSPTATRALG